MEWHAGWHGLLESGFLSPYVGRGQVDADDLGLREHLSVDERREAVPGPDVQDTFGFACSMDPLYPLLQIRDTLPMYLHMFYIL